MRKIIKRPADPDQTQIPVWLKKEIHEYATVEAEQFKKLNAHRWLYDKTSKGAYREIKKEGLLKRHFIHREAFGCSLGDGQTVIVKDGNKLNCTSSNLVAGLKRDTSFRGTDTGKKFPRKPENFLNYFKAHYTEIYQFLAVCKVVKLSYKEITLSFEEGTDEAQEARHHSFRTKLEDVLKTDFGYAGELHIVKHVVPVFETVAPKSAKEPIVVKSFDPFNQVKEGIERLKSGDILSFNLSFLFDGEIVNVDLSRKKEDHRIEN